MLVEEIKGMPGDTGEHGSCETSCRVKTVELLLKTAVENALKRTQHSNKRGLNDVEKNIICSLIKKIKKY